MLVFISYSRQDHNTAENIESYLERVGIKTWRDKSSVRDDWSKEIATALANSDVVLLIWSKASSKSEWVKHEWLTARALGKSITLVVLSELKKIPLPKPLANIESVVFKNGRKSSLNSNLRKVSDKLKRIISFKHEYEY